MKATSTVRIMLTYAIAGPFFGGVVVLLGLACSEPGLFSAKGLAFSGGVLLLSYPFGLAQALAAGIAHSVVVRLVHRHQRAVAISLSIVCGALASISFAALLGSLGRVLESGPDVAGLLLPPCVAAAVVAVYVS